MESGLAITPASSLRTCGCIPPRSMGLWASSLPKWSLAWCSLTKGKSSFLQTLSPASRVWDSWWLAFVKTEAKKAVSNSAFSVFVTASSIIWNYKMGLLFYLQWQSSGIDYMADAERPRALWILSHYCCIAVQGSTVRALWKKEVIWGRYRKKKINHHKLYGSDSKLFMILPFLTPIQRTSSTAITDTAVL